MYCRSCCSPLTSHSGGLGFAVWIDDVPGLVLPRPQDDLLAAVAKLLEVVGRDILELGEEHARFRPFSIVTERNVSDHGPKTMAADILCPLAVVEAPRCLHRLRQYLTRGVAEWDEVDAE